MQPDQIFQIVNPLVLPGWMLLLLAPGWRWTQTIASAVLPALLACVYVVALGAALHGGTDGNVRSLAGVAALSGNPMALLAGWIHYLAFDLFVGAWEVRDAHRQRISHWLVAPCVALTSLAGPLGLLLYLALRRVLSDLRN